MSSDSFLVEKNMTRNADYKSTPRKVDDGKPDGRGKAQKKEDAAEGEAAASSTTRS